MTFKELAQLLSKQQGFTTSNTEKLLFKLKDKPFWIWDDQEHQEQFLQTKGLCCFNDIVGRPTKGKKEFPLFDYEKTLYDILFASKNEADFKNNFKDKHLWILKATGLGISELMLRLIAWLCTRDDDFKDSQVVIVTGPNIDLAVGLMRRLKKIFSRLGIIFEDKETVLNLNGCHIQAYPSNHIDSFRSLSNPKFILLDESDMFRISDQPEVRHVAERYIAKSNPFIVLCSTPGAPGSLMETIEKEPDETCIYHRLRMDWTVGLGKIYTPEEIAAQRASPSWEREYNLKYAGSIGNVFNPSQIDRVIELGEQFKNVPTNDYTLHSVGVDAGFGSSRTAVVLTEFLKEEKKIRVLYSEEFEHANPQTIVDLCFNLYRKHWNAWFWIDGANRAFVNLMKVAFSESLTWETNKSKEGPNPEVWKVLPVNFATDHKNMLSHLHMLINKEYLAIPKEHDKLIISLRTAYAREYSLDKEQSSYNDSLDALRLACKMYKMN